MPSIALKAYLVANNYNAEVVLKRGSKDQDTRVVDHLRITNNETGDEVTRIPTDEEAISPSTCRRSNMFVPRQPWRPLSPDPDVQVEQKVADQKLEPFVTKFGRSQNRHSSKTRFFIFWRYGHRNFDLRVTPFDENFPEPKPMST